MVGPAFHLDGLDDAVVIGNPANLQLQSFTIDAWIRRASTTQVTRNGSNGIFFTYGGNGYAFGLHSNGRLVISKVDVSEVASSLLGVTDTNLHHIAVTKSGSTVVFYVDGVAETASSYDPGFSFTTRAAIGAQVDPIAGNFYGDIDELEIFNRALSASEVQAIYTAAQSGKCKPTGLAVYPATGFDSSGPAGGGFTPASQLYTLLNAGTNDLNWSAGASGVWVSLSATNGTLVGGASTNITVTINSTANSLAAGVYSNTVTFTNLTNGDGTTNRIATLTVTVPASLEVTPASGLSSTGLQGGPFTPSSQVYALTNSGANLLNWSASKSAGWVSLSATSGSLVAGGGTTVTVSINANANGLAVGSYTDTVTFTNTTNGIGTTGRSVILTVQLAPPIANFTGIPTNGAAPLTVSFTDASTGTITNRYWDFGDGATTNTTITSLTHTYTAAGTNTVGLTASGPLGSDTLTRNNYIVVTNWLPQVSVSPASRNYGPVTIGQTNTQPFQVINTGGGQLIGTASVGGQFAVSSGIPYSLGHGQTGTVMVSFLPLTPGSVTNLAVFDSNGGSSSNVVTGVGVDPSACLSPPSGLVSWWPGDGAGNDLHGGNHGVLMNGVTFAAGMVGRAFHFDGLDDVVTVGSPTNLQFQSFTIDAWIRRASTTQVTRNGSYGEFFTYGANGYAFALNSDGRLVIGKVNVSEVASSLLGVTDTNLHHVAVTKSGSTVVFYVDGVAETVAAYDPGFSFTTPAAIGAQVGPLAGNFYGDIDELEIFNRALSASEIQAIYNAGAAGQCKPPALTVSPATGLNSSGSTGGGFIPDTQLCTLLNNNTNALNWSAGAGAAWVSLSVTNGTLPAGGSTNVTVTINSNANSLAVGVYSNTVTFTNLTNGDGTTNRIVILTVTPPLPCISPPSGLVGWWPGDGNANDVRNGNNGVLTNGATFTAGMVGQAFHLDGLNDAVVVGNPTNLQLQSFTIDAWIRRASIDQVTRNGTDGELFSYGAGGYCLALRSNGRLVVSKVGYDEVVSSLLTVSDMNLHHVAVTKSGSTVIFYVDGVAETAAAYDPGFSFTTRVAIGATVDPIAGNFYGDIDELEIFNRALSASEIQAIYSAAQAGKCKPVVLTVSPPTGLNSSGPAGGGFTPVSQLYTLLNNGGSALNWSVGASTAWVNLSATNGTLAGGASTNVAVSINSNANSLAVGVYSNTVTFTNLTNGDGTTNRIVTLTVTVPANLGVAPTNGLSSTGLQGGPFTPSSQVYALTNSGANPLNWSASKNASWLTLSATNGSLVAGSTTTVTVSINGNANGLAAGSYGDSVTFTNLTNGADSATRSVTLTVIPLPQLSVTPASYNFGSVAVGQSSNCNFQVVNIGGSTLSGSAAVASPFSILSGGSYSLSGGQTGQVTVRFSSLAPGTFSNAVIFASNGGNSTNPVTGVASIVADLALTKTASAEPVVLGQPLTYTLTVTNGGPGIAPSVTITDTLPSGLTFVSATASQGSCSKVAGLIICDLGSLSSGGAATVQIVTLSTVLGMPSNTIFQDSFDIGYTDTVVHSDLNTNIDLYPLGRQGGGAVTSTYSVWSYTGLDEVGIRNDLGATNSFGSNTLFIRAVQAAEWGMPAEVFMDLDTDFGASLSGRLWQVSFRARQASVGSLPAEHWLGMAVGGAVNGVGGDDADLSFFIQNVAADTNVAGYVVYANGTEVGSGWLPFGLADVGYRVELTVDETVAPPLATLVLSATNGVSLPVALPLVTQLPVPHLSASSSRLVELHAHLGQSEVLPGDHYQDNLVDDLQIRVLQAGPLVNRANVAFFGTDPEPGNNTASTTNTVVATTPVANFAGSPTNGLVPLTVTFTDLSTGGISNRFWSFGDGATTNTTATNLSHMYGAGTYSVTLVVSGSGSASTNAKPNYITVWTPFAAWQQQYFGCTDCPQAAAAADPDGDGQNNLAEFLAGTDPTNSASAFRILSLSAEGNDVRVIWATAGGRTNAVQATAGDADGSYTTNFTDITIPPHIITTGSGDTTTNCLDIGGATNAPSRYYRVRLVP